jgi:pyridoxal 5'-phosphate synthase glutaminase subunit Pdx2
MKVLVTGAGGTLGKALAPMLADAGHEPVLQDVRELQTPYEFIQGDVRNPEDVLVAARGVEMIVHTAAIHGIHLRSHSPRDFYDLNLTGTFNVWEAAVEADVRGVVFSSTMGVYGESRRPASEDAVVALHEHLPLLPGDIYGWTKMAGEELGTLYERTGLDEAIRVRAAFGMPIWGTCAGMILLGTDVGDSGSRVGDPQRLLGLMDMRLRRNAFGPQLESFEATLAAPAIADYPIPAVFIRAPVIETVGPEVEVLARLSDGRPVAARQGRFLATAFHPELTDDLVVHRYFVAAMGAEPDAA